MLFNSTEFVLLVCLTFVPYYLLPSKRFQVEILILASLVFYAYSNIWLLILLVFSAYINAFSSLKISNHVELKIKRFWAIAGVITNLSILGFFKYAGLISFTILGNTGSHGEFAHYIALIPLPVGISFYTFQGISLLMDTWSGNVQSDREQSQLRHFKHITFYICFFPQLVAGPIVKSHEFLPQIKDKRISQINWERCFKNLLTGYFLKIFVADNLKELTAWIEFPYFLGKSSVELTFMLFAFSMQIFADFAGYSLIAIGIAGLFGYKLPTNFNFPYISRSFSEFWRRWHISLSTWLRDYLYYPLGGNRRGRLRTYFNLFIVMFLGGLWHGAAWSFAVWGTAHGLFLAIERMITRKKHESAKSSQNIITILKMFFVFSMVTFAWLLFKLPDFTHVISYFTAIYSNVGIPISIPNLWYILFFSAAVIAYHFKAYLQESRQIFIPQKIQILIFSAMLFLLINDPGSQGDFIYFQF